MKRKLVWKVICLLAALLICTAFVACSDDGAGGEQDDSDASTVGSEVTTPNADTPNGGSTEPVAESFDLIKDGELLYTIVRSDRASAVTVRAVVTMNNHVRENGLKSRLSDWGDDTGNEPEILVGKTKYFPEEALEGIDLTSLGTDGFVIKHYGNKILIVANNDNALLGAAEFFIENFLDFDGGKTTMTDGYCHISSSGLFLSELRLAGADISEYSVSCDAGLEEPLSYVRELIKGKCGVELAEGSEKRIVLRASGEGDVVTARFEGNDLVITAKDAEAMKKAVVCFWYENVAYSTGSLELSSELQYSRDLGKTLFYSDLGIQSSESECCLEKLYDAHAYANEKGYKVFADYGAKYYIATVGRSVIIDTDVEWGNAEFTIDDSEVTPDKRGNWIFTLLERRDEAYTIDTVKTLSRDMTNVGVTFPESSIVTFYDDSKRQYVRYGGNADNGQIKQDSVVVDRNGGIDMDAPLMWDFDRISSINVLPIDEDVLTISGGSFTTIANRAPSEYTYYARGLKINRSNTIVDGVKHYITGEGPTGAPYNGFLSLNNCAYVTVRNCIFTGHKTYQSPTTAMGSYDIGMGNAISVSFINCSQSNDINDSRYWGVSGTNYCKNFVYDGCVLSRFDAHKGVANAAIKNSVIGHAGASIIGYGTFLIENSTFMTNKIVNLRSDYGSSWEGDIIIRNCTVSPQSSSDITLITGSNKGNHDFGYPCYMPANVVIDGLTVENAKKVYVFADLNSGCSSENYVPQFPFYATETVTVKGYNGGSKGELVISPNKYLFAKTEFTVE